MTKKQIFCTECQVDVGARLTDGKEIYPHRADLADIPFWKCPNCGNHVGCHHKTTNRTNPLGHIAGPKMRQARGHIHRILDPLWQKGLMPRGRVYKEVSARLGQKNFHTAQIRTIEDARQAYLAVKDLHDELYGEVLE